MTHSTLSLFLTFTIMTSMSTLGVARRDLPPNSSDKLHPESFLGHHHEGTVLIPGFGRVMIPDKFPHKGFNPFTYNPITGTNKGTGYGIDNIGGGGRDSTSAGWSHSYVPCGDDTFAPNPGFELPNPGSGGFVPLPVGSHH